MIAACAFEKVSYDAENLSFTRTLISTLQRLSILPSFTLNYFYNLIFEKCQGFRRSDGRKIDPIHIILGRDKSRPRSIRFPTYFRVTRSSGNPSIGRQRKELEGPKARINCNRCKVSFPSYSKRNMVSKSCALPRRGESSVTERDQSVLFVKSWAGIAMGTITIPLRQEVAAEAPTKEKLRRRQRGVQTSSLDPRLVISHDRRNQGLQENKSPISRLL